MIINEFQAKEKNALPNAVCAQTTQKTLSLIISQLKKDRLYNVDVIASIKKTLPDINKAIRQGNLNCNCLVMKALAGIIAETEKEVLKKQIQGKRKDHFTRLFLMPLEEKIVKGDSLEIAPEKIPRSIIPVINKAVKWVVPHSLIEKSKILTDKITLFHTGIGKARDADWESIARDWKTVQKIINFFKKESGHIDWREVHNICPTMRKDKIKTVKLKNLIELREANEQILRNLLMEFTDPETGKSSLLKLKGLIQEHLLKETGLDPAESITEKTSASLLKALS